MAKKKDNKIPPRTVFLQITPRGWIGKDANPRDIYFIIGRPVNVGENGSTSYHSQIADFKKDGEFLSTAEVWVDFSENGKIIDSYGYQYRKLSSEKLADLLKKSSDFREVYRNFRAS